MRTTAFVFLLIVCSVWSAEMETDNKATESKSSSVVAGKDEKGKTEKRAPLVMTSVPGEYKYTPEIKYGPEVKYTPVALNVINSGRPESKYQDVKPIPSGQYYPTPAPKPQYIFYSPPPAPQMQHPMVLMFAVPHPSGQFLMLLPAQNFLHPMYYRQPVSHAPVPQYQPQYQPQYVPQGPALAQSAGFAAQQQIAYSVPYQPQEKYPSNKQ